MSLCSFHKLSYNVSLLNYIESTGLPTTTTAGFLRYLRDKRSVKSYCFLPRPIITITTTTIVIIIIIIIIVVIVVVVVVAGVVAVVAVVVIVVVIIMIMREPE
jgi:O-antigen ligase